MTNPLCFGMIGWDCSLTWIVMILLFFIGAIVKRQLFDGVLNFEFSLIGSTILSEIVFVIILLITHSQKWAFLIGLIGLFIGGLLGTKIFGGMEGGGE